MTAPDLSMFNGMAYGAMCKIAYKHIALMKWYRVNDYWVSAVGFKLTGLGLILLSHEHGMPGNSFKTPIYKIDTKLFAEFLKIKLSVFKRNNFPKVWILK